MKVAPRNHSSKLQRIKSWVTRVTFSDALMIVLTGWIALGTMVSAIAIAFQWHEMHIGGKDTTRIADASEKQTLAAQKFADSAKEINTGIGTAVDKLNIQAEQTRNLARHAAIQADIMRRQLSTYIASQVPILSLKELHQTTEQYGDDTLIKWSEEWQNSGASRPIDLRIWDDCHDGPQMQKLDFYRMAHQSFPLVIGPNSTRVLAGCETGYSTIKELDDQNLAYSARGSDFRTNFYLFGGANFRDSTGGFHRVEYCYQVMWDNRHIQLGFHLVPCLAPNNTHNCTDEECKDAPRQ